MSSVFQILDTGRTPSIIFAVRFVLSLDGTRAGVGTTANRAAETSHCVPVTPCADATLSEYVSEKATRSAEASNIWKNLDTRTAQTRIGPANMSNGMEI